MDLTVVTYGGGELLQSVFNAIAHLMNNKSGELFRPLMMVAGSVGAVLALSKAFFSSSVESIIGQYFLPFVVISGLMMVPTSSVRIEDVVTDKSYKVDHVPFLLARASAMISTVGYRMTTALERVMHSPNETNYLETGMIFGAEASLSMDDYRIVNADLERNLRRFSKQCVLYDIALDRYSIDDLKKATDLLDFFKAKTSKTRMIEYTNSDDKMRTYQTCQDAIRKMEPLFQKETSYYAKHEIYKSLPLTYQALTGLKADSEKLIRQQLVMSTFVDEYRGDAFSRSRAEMQQKGILYNTGALGLPILISTRAVLEALIYASFLFVMPLALLPGGIGFLTKWVWLAGWIQLWAPFYAILNLAMQIKAQTIAASIFADAGISHEGISLFTSVGLENLYDDISSRAGFLAASIPFISYAIIQGGVASFIHLANSMMSPAQSAASIASSEQVSGNYSFANASMGQMNYANSTIHQKQMSPYLSHGSFQVNDGVMRETFTEDNRFLEQNRSSLVDTPSLDQSFQSLTQSSLNESKGFTEEYRESLLEGISDTSRSVADFSHGFSRGLNENSGFSERVSASDQDTIRSFQGVARQYAEQHGCSERVAAHTLLKAGGSNWFFGAETGQTSGAETSEALSWMENNNVGEDVSQMWQLASNHDKMHAFGEMNDEMARMSEGINSSFDELNSFNSQYSKSMQESTALQELSSSSESHSAAFRRDLTSSYVDYVYDRFGETGARDLLTNSSRTEDRLSAQNDFLEDYIDRSMKTRIGSVDVNDMYRSKEVDSPLQADWETRKDLTADEFASQHGIRRESPDSSAMERQFTGKKSEYNDRKERSLNTIVADELIREIDYMDVGKGHLLSKSAGNLVTNRDKEAMASVVKNFGLSGRVSVPAVGEEPIKIPKR